MTLSSILISSLSCGPGQPLHCLALALQGLNSLFEQAAVKLEANGSDKAVLLRTQYIARSPDF